MTKDILLDADIREPLFEYLEMYQRDTFIYTEESIVLIDGKVHYLQEGREWIRKVG